MARRRRKITVKKQIKRDRFVEAGTRSLSYFRHHSALIGYITIGIVVIAGGVLYYSRVKGNKEDKASKLFSRGIALYSQNNIEGSISVFQDLSSKFGGTSPGIKSLYYLGNLYYFTGKHEQAREKFERYLKYAKDDILLPGALLGIADTYTEQRNFFLAQKKYEEVKKRFPKSALAPKALMSAARCAIVLGNSNKAKEIYNKIIKTYKSSVYSKEAEIHLTSIHP